MIALAVALSFAAAPGCGLASGEHVLRVDQVERTFRVQRGAKVTGSSPVVFVWHGFGGGSLGSARWARVANWDEAIFIAPHGMGRTFPSLFGDKVRPGWQIRTPEYGDRDLALFDALVALLKARGCLDEKRVFTTGFSNGGMFSHVLACHRAEVLTAAAPAGGAGPLEDKCGPPIPIHIEHGSEDPLIPVERAERSYARWGAQNGCASNAAPEPDGCVAATKCKASVELCEAPVGHRISREGMRRIVAFFRRH